ncbi:hypothetical protein L6232_22895, partial [Shewanella sp. C31]|nr:hypothetical protein [Shewanella electrica]
MPRHLGPKGCKFYICVVRGTLVYPAPNRFRGKTPMNRLSTAFFGAAVLYALAGIVLGMVMGA